MKLAEHAERHFGAELDRARAAWMEPAWRLAGDLHLGLTEAERRERGQRIGLDRFPAGLRRRARPVTARACKRR